MTYDIELGIGEIAKARARRDPLTRETARLADQIAAGFRGDFDGVLDMEICGKALVIAASALVPLCSPCSADIPGTVLANMIALTGENLVRNARLQAVRSGGDGQ